MKYDVIVVGGGFAGTAAAVSAAREGAKVLLLEKSGFLGGAAGNCYVNPFMGYTTKIDGKMTLLSDGIFTEILDRLEKKGGLMPNRVTFSEEVLKLVFDEMTEESGVDVLFHAYLLRAERDCDRIKSVTIMGKGGEMTFEADYFIDATGDADLTACAGAPYRIGREDDNLCQPKFKYVADGVLHLNSTRIVKRSPFDLYDLSFAEREARRQMFELYTFLKENCEGFENSTLLSSAPEIGVRESRMIDGVYTLTVTDLKDCVHFEDGIAACNYDIDIHNPEGTGTSHYYFKEGTYYTIPYRSLMPKNIKNLLAAGRCISGSHEAQASFRIMPTCCSTGEAAGVAAAVAAQEHTDFPETDVKKIQALLRKHNAFIGE